MIGCAESRHHHWSRYFRSSGFHPDQGSCSQQRFSSTFAIQSTTPITMDPQIASFEVAPSLAALAITQVPVFPLQIQTEIIILTC
jgi:hypothetical protein